MTQSRTMMGSYGHGVTRGVEKDDGQWMVEVKLKDLKVNCLATDPQSPEVVFAGSTRSGIWRSEDAGGSWQPIGMTGHHIKSIAVSPHDPDVLYAGTKPAYLHKSEDGGQTWRELEGFRQIPNRWWWFSPADPSDLNAYVMAIAIHPQDPEVMLAGIELGAVVRSEDGGQSWSRHRKGSLRDCHSLQFHALEPNWVYEAGGGGVALSQDGGKRWQKQNRGLAKRYGIVCAADPVDPEIWYACVGASPWNAFGDNPRVYLYRSDEAGWQPIGWQSHPLNETPTVLVTTPGVPGHLYAGIQQGAVLHSADYGQTWERLPLDLGGIWHNMFVVIP